MARYLSLASAITATAFLTVLPGCWRVRSDGPTRGIILNVDPRTRFQSFVGWRATTLGPNLYGRPIPPLVLDQILDDFAFDLGLNGLRIEQHYMQEVLEINSKDPFLITVNGKVFDFSKKYLQKGGGMHDSIAQIQQVVMALKKRVESRGELFTTYINPIYFHWEDFDPAWHTPSGYADFAEAYVTWYHQVTGAYPTYWSLVNEPNAAKWYPELFHNVVAVGKRFAQRGIPTKLQVLEGPTPYGNDIEALAKIPEALQFIGLISFHGYDYQAPGPPDFYGRNVARDVARQHRLPTAMTEICCQDGWDGSYRQALGWARDIYWNLTEADVSVWEPLAMMTPCERPGCPDGSQDPIALDPDLTKYHKFPAYYGLRQFSHYIRPGYVRVATTCSGCTAGPVGQNIKPVAFQSSAGKMVLVVINDQDVEQNISISGLSAGTYDFTGVTPRATKGTSSPTQAIVRGQSLTFVLPARGIFTILEQ